MQMRGLIENEMDAAIHKRPATSPFNSQMDLSGDGAGSTGSIASYKKFTGVSEVSTSPRERCCNGEGVFLRLSSLYCETCNFCRDSVGNRVYLAAMLVAVVNYIAAVSYGSTTDERKAFREDMDYSFTESLRGYPSRLIFTIAALCTFINGVAVAFMVKGAVEVVRANVKMLTMATAVFVWNLTQALHVGLLPNHVIFSLVMECCLICMWVSLFADVVMSSSLLVNVAWVGHLILTILAYGLTYAADSAAIGYGISGASPALHLARLVGERAPSSALEQVTVVFVVCQILTQACLVYVAFRQVWKREGFNRRSRILLFGLQVVLIASCGAKYLYCLSEVEQADGLKDVYIVDSLLDSAFYLFAPFISVVVMQICNTEIQTRKRILEIAIHKVNLAEGVAEARAQLIRWGFHELRVPFNSVKLGLEDLRESVASGDVHESLMTLDLMEEAGVAMERILNDVLMMQKMETGAFKLVKQPTSIRRIIKSAVRQMQPAFLTNGITPHISISDDLPALLEMDPQRVMQVLTNYLSNAVKFGRTHVVVRAYLARPAVSPQDVTQPKHTHLGTIMSSRAEGKNSGSLSSTASDRLPRQSPLYSPVGTMDSDGGRRSVPVVEESTCCVPKKEVYAIQSEISKPTSNTPGMSGSPDSDPSAIPESGRPVSPSRSTALSGNALRSSSGHTVNLSSIQASLQNASAQPPSSRRSPVIQIPPTPPIPNSPSSPSALPSSQTTSPQNGQDRDSGSRRDDRPEWVTIRMEVEDDGCGIGVEDQKKLFVPFQQIKPAELQKGKGTGLGLSICKELAQLHGGSVGLQSEVNAGSTFFFELPLKVVSWESNPDLIDHDEDDGGPHLLQGRKESLALRVQSGADMSPPVTMEKMAQRIAGQSSESTQNRVTAGSSLEGSPLMAVHKRNSQEKAKKVEVTLTDSGMDSSNCNDSVKNIDTASVRATGTPSQSEQASSPSVDDRVREGEDSDGSVGSSKLSRSSRRSPAYIPGPPENALVGSSAALTIKSTTAHSPMLTAAKFMRPLTVLVVDDVASNRLFLSRALRRRLPAIRIVEAVDGGDALRTFDRSVDATAVWTPSLLPGGATGTQSPFASTASSSARDGLQFDVVLMDKEMPVVDGYAATRELRKRGFTGIILGVTANAFGKDIDEFMAQGLDGVITKPVDMDNLVSRILGLRAQRVLAEKPKR